VDILSEPTPEALPDKIIDHLQNTFSVQWSTLWLTEQTGIGGQKRLRLAAAGGDATKLLTAQNGEPAVYDFGEGLTGEIAQRMETVNITKFEDFKKHKHARKYDHVMYPQAKAEDKCRCVLGVPLLLGSAREFDPSEKQPWRVIGVLKLENVIESVEHPEAYFTPRDVEIAEGYAAVIAVALEKAQMRADSIRSGAGLLEVSRSLLAGLGEPPNFDEIVKQTANAISAEACALWLRSGLQLRLKAAYGYHGSKGRDLRLMSSVNNVSGIPTEGRNRIIVAAVNNVLHFRIFDGNGKVVVDTDEKKLTGQARQIEDLKKQLESLWPPHELTRSENDRVITAVTSIVGHTRSKQEVPPYRLEMAAEENGQTTRGTATQFAVERAEYKGVGLTVYVAQTGKSLNLTTAEEIRNHFAWKGANDERMWGKPRGNACYSLVALPLIDSETGDLVGVFKIENKKPTLFQFQSYFTREDEQLLTILGNSIGFSLIISERIGRLRRMERLLGSIRVLYDLDEALFFILTGLTHRNGLQYSRAMIFLVDEAVPTKLVCRFALGQIEPAQWQAEMDRMKDEGLLDLDMLLRNFRENKQKFLRNDMMDRWKGLEVDIGDRDSNIIARHAATLELSTSKFLSGSLRESDILYGFAQGDFVLIPIMIEKRLKGIIYADNRFTRNRVNQFECEMLDLFAGMSGAIIQASGVPEKLQKERDEAWKEFSRPAAHRVGTEAGIIEGEAILLIKRELDQAAVSGERLAVRGEVIRNALQVIQQAVNRLRLTAKDYQRLSAGAEDPVEFDLCKLIDLTIQSTTSNFKGITVLPQHRDQPMWIRAARGGITYVFEELLINAWKQVESDEDDKIAGERLETRICIELRREKDSVICTVSDNGPGIPPMLIPTLFQRPQSGRRGGTGLGLYICGQILRQNGGTIELLTEGKPAGYDGACFRITLPLEGSRRLERNAPESEPTQRVLVVEDDPVLRRHLAQVLADNGFSSDLVRNENEAVKRVSTTLRAIITDINLSEAGGDIRGGIFLAEQLAHMELRIPTILISYDPWYYLPPENSPKFLKMKEDYCLHAILDRNDPSFNDELVKSLRKATGEA